MSNIDLDLGRKLRFDRQKGQLVTTDKSGDQLVLAMPMAAFFGLVDHLFEMFMSGATVILEGAGEGAGRAAVRNIISSDDPLALLQGTMNRGSRWGHGRYELIELDISRKRAKTRIHDCVFARKADTEQRTMWYIRGYLKGVFAEFFKDSKLSCNETRCMSLGEKYCEFEIAPL